MMIKLISGMLLAISLTACYVSHDDRNLLNEAHEIFYEGKKNPGPAKFHTDTLGTVKCQNAARAMKGTNLTPEEGRKVIREYLESARRDSQWSYVPPAMKIPMASGQIHIDGQIRQNEWQGALLLRGQYAIGQQQRDTRDNPSWRLLWDKEHLYIAGEFRNTQYRQVGKTIYAADCLEVFIRIDRRIRLYWEMIVNFENKLFCDYRSLDYWGGFSDHRMPEGVFPGVKYQAIVNNGVMTVEMALPWRLIPGFANTRSNESPRRGEEILFSLVRVMSNPDNDRLDFYSAVPLLYGGHNLYGQITGVLE